MNKSNGADKIFFNVIKNCFGELSHILRYVFHLSLQTGIFTDSLKIAKVTPVFKTDDLHEISNYHPISALPCTSKKLERIMHNRLYSYLLRSYFVIFEAVRLPKRSFHRTCHCSIGWPNSWIIWKRQLHNWARPLWRVLFLSCKPFIAKQNKQIISCLFPFWNQKIC